MCHKPPLRHNPDGKRWWTTPNSVQICCWSNCKTKPQNHKSRINFTVNRVQNIPHESGLFLSFRIYLNVLPHGKKIKVHSLITPKIFYSLLITEVLIWPSERRKKNADPLVLAQSFPILTYQTNFEIRFLGYLLLPTKSKILRHTLLSK